MIRVDYETRDAGAAASSRTNCASASRPQLRQADIVLISDYDKGVCTPGLLAAVDRRGASAAACACSPTRSAAAITASTTAARRSRPTGSKRAWPPAATLTTTDEALAAAAATSRHARPGSGHRHARQGRHGPGPPRRPAADLPDPAAAGLRHHRRRRHGAERARHGPGRRRRLRRRHPPGQRRRRPGGREDRRRHGDARRNPARPAARRGRAGTARQKVLPLPTCCPRAGAAAAGSASASPSPTAASTCCTPATCSTCTRPGPRPTCWSSASTATPACARSKGRTGRSTREDARAVGAGRLAGGRLRDRLRRGDAAGADPGRPARRAGQGRRLPQGRGGRRGVRRVVRRPRPPGARCARVTRPPGLLQRMRAA